MLRDVRRKLRRNKKSVKKVAIGTGITIVVIGIGIYLVKSGNDSIIKNFVARLSDGEVFDCVGEKMEDLIAEGYDPDEVLDIASFE